MTLRFTLAAVPLMLLAGCGGSTEGGSGNGASTAAAPATAAVKPPPGKQWTDVVSQTPEGGYRMGNPDAPVKLVEYGSRLCPVCGLFGREGTRPLEEKYVSTGKVSYEFREFLVHGPPDLPAALLGTCAGAEPFFPLLEQMFVEQEPFETKLGDQAATSALQARTANQTPPQVAAAWADYLGLVDFVKQRGIPEAQARACLANSKEIDRIVKVMDDGAQNKNVSGTPTFFINGEHANAVNWTQLEPQLKAAGG